MQKQKSKPLSSSEPIQKLNNQNRFPKWRLLFFISIGLIYWIFKINTDLRELIHEMNTTPTASGANKPINVAKPIQIADESILKSQPSPPLMPTQDNSPPVIGNSIDMFSWIGGIDENLKSSCLSPSNRQIGGSVESGTSNTRIQAEGLWCFFDNTTQLYEIRMDAPFAGSVDEIHIGDPSNRLNVLGAPDRQIALIPGKPESLFYKLGSVYTLRIERDNANMIETMLIIK